MIMRTVTVAMLAGIFATPAFAAHKTSAAQDQVTQAKKVWRHHVVNNRRVTWKWQEKAGLDKSVTRRLERHGSIPYLRHLVRMWWKRAYHAMRVYHRNKVAHVTYYSSGVNGAICAAFGSYCSQALAVARCESGLSTAATNGQYLGLFQMGESERSHYGHSGGAWGQAQAAYRYFRDSGYSWGPWSCKP
jgi:hypothetical protein